MLRGRFFYFQHFPLGGILYSDAMPAHAFLAAGSGCRAVGAGRFLRAAQHAASARSLLHDALHAISMIFLGTHFRFNEYYARQSAKIADAFH